MKVFVTGATGFIGQNLTKRLVEEGFSVVCLIRDIQKRNLLPDEVQVICKDLVEFSAEDFPDDIDIVFHVAAQLGHYTITQEVYEAVNYEATKNLLSISQRKGVKQFVFCSAGFVTGYGKEMTEKDRYHASKGYAETKAKAEKVIIKKSTKDTNWTIIRPGYIYGPGDDRRVALYKSIKKGSFVLTTDGKAEFSPTYIDDFLDGVMLVVNNKKAYGEIYNICGKNETIMDYFDTIAKVEGVRLKKVCIGYNLTKFFATVLDGLSMKVRNKPGIITPSRADFIGKDHSLSNRKICDELGFVVRTSMEDGIRKSIEWAIDNHLM